MSTDKATNTTAATVLNQEVKFCDARNETSQSR